MAPPQMRLLVALLLTLLSACRPCSAQLNCKSVQGTPAGLTCGARGTARIGKFLRNEPQRVGGLQACRNLCLRRQASDGVPGAGSADGGACASFSFAADTGICETIFPAVAELNFRPDQSSATAFYDVGCFRCEELCPQLLGSQVLDNGGFQSSADLLGPWDLFAFRNRPQIVSPGRNSSRAFQVDLSDPPIAEAYASLIQAFNQCEAYYNVSFDYRITPSRDSASSFHFSYGDALDYTVYTTDGTNGSWTTHNTVIKSPGAQASSPDRSPAPISFSFFPNATFALDNVLVAPAGALAPADANLLRNPGFEIGVPEPWRIRARPAISDSANFSISAPGLDPSSPRLALRFVHNQPFNDVFSLAQTITGTVPGRTYLLTFKYQHLHSKYNRKESISLRVVFGDRPGPPPARYTTFYNRLTANAPADDETVRSFSEPFTAVAEETYLLIEGKPGIFVLPPEIPSCTGPSGECGTSYLVVDAVSVRSLEPLIM